jgi:hypothetical protein
MGHPSTPKVIAATLVMPAARALRLDSTRTSLRELLMLKACTYEGRNASRRSRRPPKHGSTIIQIVDPRNLDVRAPLEEEHRKGRRP